MGHNTQTDRQTERNIGLELIQTDRQTEFSVQVGSRQTGRDRGRRSRDSDHCIMRIKKKKTTE